MNQPAGQVSECGCGKYNCPNLACRKAYNRAWRKAHPDAVKRYSRAWRKAHPEYGKLVMRAWRQNRPDAAAAIRRKYKENWRDRILAHKAVERAVKAGRLVRPPACSACGTNGLIEAHHPDHSKQLEVQWLCRTCHVKADDQLKGRNL